MRWWTRPHSKSTPTHAYPSLPSPSTRTASRWISSHSGWPFWGSSSRRDGTSVDTTYRAEAPGQRKAAPPSLSLLAITDPANPSAFPPRQVSNGWGVPFPLNLVLWPLDIVEWVRRHPCHSAQLLSRNCARATTRASAFCCKHCVMRHLPVWNAVSAMAALRQRCVNDASSRLSWRIVMCSMGDLSESPLRCSLQAGRFAAFPFLTQHRCPCWLLPPQFLRWQISVGYGEELSA